MGDAYRNSKRVGVPLPVESICARLQRQARELGESFLAELVPPVVVSDANAVCREFVVSNYAEMKKTNPHFPILVRECAGAEAKLTARYGG
jgi:hypothetical protein